MNLFGVQMLMNKITLMNCLINPQEIIKSNDSESVELRCC